MSLRISIVEGDILETGADIAAFKYAGGLHGADKAAVERLIEAGRLRRSELKLAPGEHRWVQTLGALRAPEALFVGTERLGWLTYASLRDLAAQTVKAVADRSQSAHRLAMTVHGPGVGLDAIEAMLAQVGGCNDAWAALDSDRSLAIAFVERDGRRAAAMEGALAELTRAQPEYRRIERHDDVGVEAAPTASELELPRAGAALHLDDPDAKPAVFVAMPFGDEWDDVFHLGIQAAVHACGYRCERVDQAHFTGDVLTQVKKRIEQSDMVVAELCGANANVYLEVGYAWGCDRPTILLLRGDERPKFDLEGQRYLTYKKIMDLRDLLQKELEGLARSGVAKPAAA